MGITGRTVGFKGVTRNDWGLLQYQCRSKGSQEMTGDHCGISGGQRVTEDEWGSLKDQYRVKGVTGNEWGSLGGHRVVGILEGYVGGH